MALAGTLKDFGLPDIVQLIGLQRKTGVLHLKTEGESVNVLFENGNIVAADSTLSRPSDRIGNALVTRGDITKSQLDEALALQKETMQRLGHVLVAEQVISEDTLRQAVEAQLLQIVFRLFRWRQGDYNFEAQNTVDYERMGAVSLAADFVLMEGIRMVDEWPIIERRIPSMTAVFRRVVDPNQVQAKAMSDDGLDALMSSGSAPAPGGKLALSGDELLVFQAVDGKKSCQQIVESTPLHDFAVCRTLLDLMDRDLVALTDIKGSTARAKADASAGTARIAFMAVAVAAALFGVFWNRTSPFGLAGLPPLIQPVVDIARDARLMERLELADARVRGFRIAYGRLPASLDELVSEGLATRSSVEGLRFKVRESGYVVEASGPGGPLQIERTFPVQGAAEASPAEIVPSREGAASPAAAPPRS